MKIGSVIQCYTIHAGYEMSTWKYQTSILSYKLQLCRRKMLQNAIS